MIPVLRYAALGDPATPSARPWTVGLDAFAEHLRAIVASGRVPLTASRFADGPRIGDAARDAVVLTFDGGSADVGEAVRRAAASGVAATLFVPTGRLERPGMLRRRDLAHLAGLGAEIGGAGHTYRRFDELDPSDQRAEAERCRDDLAEIIGRPPSAFAYPYGTHNAAARSAVRAAGYTCAYATGETRARSDGDEMAVARLTVRAATSPQTVVAWLAADHRRGGLGREALRAAAARLGWPWVAPAPRPERPLGPRRSPGIGQLAGSGWLESRTRPVRTPAPVRTPSPTRGRELGPGGRPIVTLHLPDQGSAADGRGTPETAVPDRAALDGPTTSPSPTVPAGSAD
jgi:peptidoglycan/xylan/chitin deacetylase (PgdA/CDA1 family)